MSKTETQSEAQKLSALLNVAMAFDHGRIGTDRRFVEMDATVVASVDAELRRLDAENKALRADAERYRWLRDFHNGPDGVFSGLPYISAGDGNDSAWALTGVTADAGIDAAMEAAKNGGAA